MAQLLCRRSRGTIFGPGLLFVFASVAVVAAADAVVVGVVVVVVVVVVGPGLFFERY